MLRSFRSYRLALAAWLHRLFRQRRAQRVLVLLLVLSASAAVLDQSHVLELSTAPAPRAQARRPHAAPGHAQTSSGRIVPDEALLAPAPPVIDPAAELPAPPLTLTAPRHRAVAQQHPAAAPPVAPARPDGDLGDSEAPPGAGPRDLSFAQASLPNAIGGGQRDGGGFDDPARPQMRAQAAGAGDGGGDAPPMPSPGPGPAPGPDTPLQPIDTLLPQGNVGQALTPQVATVPEPPTVLLLGSGLLLVGLRQWRQRRTRATMPGRQHNGR